MPHKHTVAASICAQLAMALATSCLRISGGARRHHKPLCCLEALNLACQGCMGAASQAAVQVSDPSFETAQSELSQLRAQLQKAQAAAGRSGAQNGGRAQVGAQTQHTSCSSPNSCLACLPADCRFLPSLDRVMYGVADHCNDSVALSC